VSKTQFLSEHGRATKLASSRSLGDVRLISNPLTAHDVRKQHGLTSICGTSDVVKVSVIARSLSSTQHAFFIPHRRRPLKFFMIILSRVLYQIREYLGVRSYKNCTFLFLQPYCCCRYRSICEINLGPIILTKVFFKRVFNYKIPNNFSAPTPKMPILEYRVCDDLWVVSRPVFHEDSKSGLRFVSRLVEDYEFFIQTLGDPSRQKKIQRFMLLRISMGTQWTAELNQSNQIISCHI
jgi:hypothetical protein